jgi:hypothetical protein
MAHCSRQAVGGIQVGRHDSHAEHLFEKIGNLLLGGSPAANDSLLDVQRWFLKVINNAKKTSRPQKEEP